MSILVDLPAIDKFSVSVIVPTYNRERYIEECLDSLLAQTWPAFEIIVVDDGSSDNTADKLLHYGNKIRYIKKENGGKSSAVNLAMSLVTGNLIWLFDDDDVALPYAIEHRVTALQRCPDAGFVYSSYCWGDDGADGRIVRGKLNNAPCYEGDQFFSALLKGCFLSLNSALVRVEVYRAVGDFDVSLVTSEDYDMLLRIAYRFKSSYSHEPSFIARQHLGFRGPKEHRTPGQARAKIFQKYDSVVGRKLRNSLMLGDFLVPRVSELSSIEQTRQALLARMIVMAGKACITEMFDDLYAFLATLNPDQNITSSESDMLTTAICTGYAYPAIRSDFSTFKQCLNKLSNTTSNKQARHALAKGFFMLAKSYPGSITERMRKLFICMIIKIGV